MYLLKGFDQIFTLPSDLPLVMDIGYVLRLIAQVDASPRLPKPDPWTLSRGGGYSPRGVRGGRGRGRGRGSGISRGRGNGAGLGGNRFNAVTRPSGDQLPASPWDRLGPGATLAAASSSSAAMSSPSSTPSSQPQETRAQMAQAAEARRRRAMEQAHPTPSIASSSHTTSLTASAPNSDVPTKRIVIDLSSDDA